MNSTGTKYKPHFHHHQLHLPGMNGASCVSTTSGSQSGSCFRITREGVSGARGGVVGSGAHGGVVLVGSGAHGVVLVGG